MKFQYNATGVKPSGGEYTPLPEGYYDLKIYEVESGKSRNGDPLMTVHFEVVNSLALNGKKVRYYNVTFLPNESSGAGMAVWFLKCIGEPWEGDFQVDTDNWIGRRLRAKVTIGEYKAKDGSMRKKNDVKSIEPCDPQGFVQAVKTAEKADEEIPF